MSARDGPPARVRPSEADTRQAGPFMRTACRALSIALMPALLPAAASAAELASDLVVLARAGSLRAFSYALVHRAEVIVAGTQGVTDPERGTPASARTPFALASVTRPLVGTLAAVLAECVFRRIVTGRSGNVTADSGIVTGRSGIVTEAVPEGCQEEPKFPQVGSIGFLLTTASTESDWATTQTPLAPYRRPESQEVLRRGATANPALNPFLAARGPSAASGQSSWYGCHSRRG